MKKNDNGQMMFDFGTTPAPQEGGVKAVPTTRKVDAFTFPRRANELPLLDTLAVCLNEIQDYLSSREESLYTFIFKNCMFEGVTTKEVGGMTSTQFRIPTRERIRQILEYIADMLRSGERCAKLHGVRLSPSVAEELRRVRASACGFFVDDTVLSDEHSSRLRGVATLLSMYVVEADTVLPILTKKFLLSVNRSIGGFRALYRAVMVVMEEDVRPMTIEQIMAAASLKLGKEVKNRDEVELILTDYTVFDTVEGEDGSPCFRLRFEHLKVYQQMARIVYEKKRISISDIAQDLHNRGANPKAITMTMTCKKFPWCIPMGKTLWIYREGGERMERIQDVIKAYCEEHVRFTYDEIYDYLRARDYDMVEASIRNYITQHCRRLNADRNMFCLTSMVPKEEEHLWFKKHIPTTRHRKVPYQEAMIDRMAELIAQSPEGYILRRELKNMVSSFLVERGVSLNNFYKILNSCSRLKVIEVEGEMVVVRA